MRLLSAALALTLICVQPTAAQPPARPQSLVQRLETYCMATQADGAAAIAAARRDGLVAVPEMFVREMGLEADFEGVRALWTVFDGGVLMLLTGRTKKDEDGLSGDVCGVATIPPEVGASQQLESWLGLPRGGLQEYNMFRIENGRRKVFAEDDAGEALRGVRDGSFYVAAAQTDREMSMLLLVKMRI